MHADNPDRRSVAAILAWRRTAKRIAEVLAASHAGSYAAGEFAASTAEYQSQQFAGRAQPQLHRNI